MKIGVVRRNIELDPDAMERVTRLQEKFEATSGSEVIRRALKIVDDIIKHTGQTRSIRINNFDGTITELLLF